MHEEQEDKKEELQTAIRLVEENYLTVLCSQYRNAELQHYSELEQQVRVARRRKKQQREYDVIGSAPGTPGRPLSPGGQLARTYAIDGVPYVWALYEAKRIMESPPMAGLPPRPLSRLKLKGVKRTFDREYRAHGVQPPKAPPGWGSYDLSRIDVAGWPDGWLRKWKPEIICPWCNEPVVGECRKALMKGPHGIAWYPVHSACADNVLSAATAHQ